MTELRPELRVPAIDEAVVAQLIPSAEYYNPDFGHPSDRNFDFEDVFLRTTGFPLPGPGGYFRSNRLNDIPLYVRQMLVTANLPQVENLSKTDILAALERLTAPDCPPHEIYFLLKMLEWNLNDPDVYGLLQYPAHYFKFFPCQYSQSPAPLSLEIAAETLYARRKALVAGSIQGPLVYRINEDE